MQLLIFSFSIFLIALLVYAATKKKKPLLPPGSKIVRQLLEKYVLFYQKLSATEKTRFETAVQNFLQKVTITGIKTTVEDMDRVFVAASAIIPIFAFDNWEYRYIHEVLLYPGSFNHEYQLEGMGRDTLGMVGNGPMQFVMLLSRHDLRNGFLNNTDKSNTGIHEFVHLVDKEDGSIDGIPEALLTHKYALPWLKKIQEEIAEIKKGNSDINPYGATNEAEFFAVAAEYFFEKPDLMQENHPELYKMLVQVFLPDDDIAS